MKIRIMFDTAKDLGAFMAKPQDLVYTNAGYEWLGSFCIDADLNGLTTLEQIKNRAVNGAVIPQS